MNRRVGSDMSLLRQSQGTKCSESASCTMKSYTMRIEEDLEMSNINMELKWLWLSRRLRGK
jgi:hypothetical protein